VISIAGLKGEMKLITCIALAWFSLCVTAQAVSFDCGKATSTVEKLICGNDDLSKLDDNLSKTYQQAIEKSADKQKVTKDQRQWLKEVRNSCQDESCLGAAYQKRISGLVMIAQQTSANAIQSDWLSNIGGNYYGGPSIKNCVITLPRGNRRCNCLSIRKQSDTAAIVTFDRHDSHDSYVCSGEGVAKVSNGELVLCANEKDKSDCITIAHNDKGLTFHGDSRSGYCGMGATIEGMNFRYSDRVQTGVNCGP
jgi:uncharacterized protein